MPPNRLMAKTKRKTKRKNKSKILLLKPIETPLMAINTLTETGEEMAGCSRQAK